MTGQAASLNGQAAVQDPKPAGLIRQPPEDAMQDALQELQSVEYYSKVSLPAIQESLSPPVKAQRPLRLNSAPQLHHGLTAH